MLCFRSVSTLFVCLVLCCAGASAQPAATFTTKTFPAGVMPRNVYAVDVNNDGTPDLIEDTLQGGNTISEQIAYGTGNFAGPKTIYTFPSQYQGTAAMASGDLNGDNKVDLVFALAGSNQLAVFLGNGDGTFQAPKYETIALPGGQWFGGGAIVAADFTGDGKIDLVTEGNTSTTEALYLMAGDGKGNFGAPQAIYSFAANTGMGSLGIGDFDGDAKADLAFSVNSQCSTGGCGKADVYVLYGNGAGGFTTDAVYSTTNIAFATGDVNSDGRTDIFGIGGSDNKQLVVLTSQPGRQFTTFTMTANETLSGSAGTAPPMVLADFNGDTKMDLATLGTTGSASEFVVFLANGSGGYQEQTVSIGSAQYLSNAVVGNFGRDARPDLAAVWSSTPSSATLTVAQDTTASGDWGNCSSPAYPGGSVEYCSPGEQSQNTVRIAAGASSWGQMRKLAAWVDGKKVGEQYHVWENRGWLDLTTSLSPGSHEVTVFAADVDNRLESFSHFPIDVVACDAPSSPGVTICSPASGSVGEHVKVVAAATVTGTPAHFELWLDGKMQGDTGGNTPYVQPQILSAGAHRIALLAVNASGEKWESVVNVTVPQDLGCHAPSSPGVNLCSPVTGQPEEESGVVEILATGHVTGTLARMELWIDGHKQTSESSSSTMHFAQFDVGPGTHRIAVLAVNTTGQVWESAATVTSQ